MHPACRLCGEVQEDILKVIVDLPQYRAQRKVERAAADKASKKEGKVQAASASEDPLAQALANSLVAVAEDVPVEDPGSPAGPVPVGGFQSWEPPAPEFPEFDTGGWELLLRDKQEVKAPKYTGLHLELVGSGLLPSRKKKGKELPPMAPAPLGPVAVPALPSVQASS